MRFLRFFGPLESWLGRGLFQMFAGLLVLSSNEAGCLERSDSRPRMPLQDVGGAWLCATGALYFLLGLLCFRLLKERQLRKVRARRDAEQEMDNLAQRKHDIERLLEETEQKLSQL